ncbi:MAG TPA: hypothetical protein VIJ39_13330 [Solirubrobacteraceae bacterium]
MSDFHSDHKHQLLRAVDALFGAPHSNPARQIRSRRRLPVLVAIMIGALLLAAAAFAASRIIGVGSPVRPSGGPERSSLSTGVGIPVQGSHSRHRSASLLPISVPDPAGGLPWGMRIVTTTRGLLCVQIGRLLDDRLGVLGQDGQFKNDRLFHELPAGALDQSTCSQPDVVALYREFGPAAASPLPGEIPSCSYPGSPRAEPSAPPSCPAQDERMIAFGVLGPHAVSVSYKATNRVHTVETSGSHGAYLIVFPRPPAQAPVNGDFMAASIVPTEQLPVAAIQGYLLSTIVFRFGDRRCQTGPEHQPGGPPACTASRTATPVLSPPAASNLHSRVTLVARKRAEGYALDLTFIAPAAVHNANTAYGAEYTMRGSYPCEAGGAGQPIERDIKRGQRVHVVMSVNQKPGCHGMIYGRILLGRQGAPLAGPTYDERTVGRFSFDLP